MAKLNDVFTAKVLIFGPRLEHDLGIADFQAAGVFGNAGHESGGLRSLQEVGHKKGRGGFGWFQWTGPRRVAFESWCKSRGLSVVSDEANYGFLVHELTTTYKNVVAALKRTRTLNEAVQVFEKLYEAAGVVSMASRESWGRLALSALTKGKAGHVAVVAKVESQTKRVAAKKVAPRKHAAPVRHRTGHHRHRA